MSVPGKETWYDWGGANEWIFQNINAIRGGEYYDDTMIALSEIANHHHFPYYIAGLIVFALLSYAVRKIKKRGGSSHLLAAWFGVLLVLTVGYATEGEIIRHTKDYFGFPRPYMVLSHDTRVLEVRPTDDDYHSFPSGHTAFITLMVVGLWPVLSGNMKWVGAALIVGVAWSRMALGVHFPADVVTSFLIFFPMTLIIRAIIYRILRRAFNIKC